MSSEAASARAPVEPPDDGSWPAEVNVYRLGPRTLVEIRPSARLEEELERLLRAVFEVVAMVRIAFGPPVAVRVPGGGTVQLTPWFQAELDRLGVALEFYDP